MKPSRESLAAMEAEITEESPQVTAVEAVAEVNPTEKVGPVSEVGFKFGIRMSSPSERYLKAPSVRCSKK